MVLHVPITVNVEFGWVFFFRISNGTRKQTKLVFVEDEVLIWYKNEFY